MNVFTLLKLENLPHLQEVVLKEDPISVENVANQKEVTAFAHMIITQVKINWDLNFWICIYLCFCIFWILAIILMEG